MGDVILGIPADPDMDPATRLAHLLRAVHYAEACQQEAIDNLLHINATLRQAIKNYREAEAEVESLSANQP